MYIARTLSRILSLLVLVSFLFTSNVYGLRPALQGSKKVEKFLKNRQRDSELKNFVFNLIDRAREVRDTLSDSDKRNEQIITSKAEKFASEFSLSLQQSAFILTFLDTIEYRANSLYKETVEKGATKVRLKPFKETADRQAINDFGMVLGYSYGGFKVSFFKDDNLCGYYLWTSHEEFEIYKLSRGMINIRGGDEDWEIIIESPTSAKDIISAFFNAIGVEKSAVARKPDSERQSYESGKIQKFPIPDNVVIALQDELNRGRKIHLYNDGIKIDGETRHSLQLGLTTVPTESLEGIVRRGEVIEIQGSDVDVKRVIGTIIADAKFNEAEDVPISEGVFSEDDIKALQEVVNQVGVTLYHESANYNEWNKELTNQEPLSISSDKIESLVRKLNQRLDESGFFIKTRIKSPIIIGKGQDVKKVLGHYTKDIVKIVTMDGFSIREISRYKHNPTSLDL